MDNPKAWTCKNGHILGQVVRNGNGIRQLVVYRHAIDANDEDPAAVDVIAVGEGLLQDVVCDLCGCVRTWVPGEESIRQLLKRRGYAGAI